MSRVLAKNQAVGAQKPDGEVQSSLDSEDEEYGDEEFLEENESAIMIDIWKKIQDLLRI